MPLPHSLTDLKTSKYDTNTCSIVKKSAFDFGPPESEQVIQKLDEFIQPSEESIFNAQNAIFSLFSNQGSTIIS